MAFRQLTPNFFVSEQITTDDVAQAAADEFGVIINNRPEGESPDQTSGDVIAATAADNGIEYVAIPVGHGGFSQPQIQAMVSALNSGNGRALAYCRSGTRSTFLWALANASQGQDPQTLVDTAATAGYDISSIRAMLDMLAANAKG